MPDTDGALAGALAKAQLDFAPVKRNKTVTVKMKGGGEYSFAYAPLDTILEAVRKPLADNGLAVVQLLDDGDLVTILMHSSGERLAGRVGLPTDTDIQGLGSAITYLRRYAIQALLGIAAEEDDDGNRASGNTVRTDSRQSGDEVEKDGDGLIGEVEVGKPPVDMNLRQTKEGPAWGFKLKSGRKGFQALAVGPLADALAIAGLTIGERATVWGPVELVPWQKDGKDMPSFARIHIERVRTTEWELPVAVEEAATLALGLSEEEKAAIGGSLPDA